MTIIHIKQLSGAITPKSSGVIIEAEGKKEKILLSRVKVGYGYKVFFSCPICGKNSERIIFEDGLFSCSKCSSAKQYRGIQNTTKGGDDFIAYKMLRFSMKVGIGQFNFPFDYAEHPKPKGKHSDKWNKNLAIMQCLENMRFQSIFNKKIWDLKVIQSVEQGKNRFLSLPLLALKDSIFPIEKGI